MSKLGASEFSQSSVTIQDKRNLRQTLRLIGEAGGGRWIRVGADDISLPRQTLSRFPTLEKAAYLPGANTSFTITEPSEQAKGSWSITFDKCNVGHSINKALGWRIGYSLTVAPAPEEMRLRVDSYGTIFELAATEEPLVETIRRGSLALDRPTNTVLNQQEHLPLEVPEVLAVDRFAVLALAVCRDEMWK